MLQIRILTRREYHKPIDLTLSKCLSIQHFEKKSCNCKRIDLYFPLSTGGVDVAASQSTV